jgi:hypothetical protein
MTNPDADPRIQSLPSPPSTPASLANDAAPRVGRTLRGAILFGLFVGLVMGPLVAALSCWLIGSITSLWQWVQVGAALGPVGGACIAFFERKVRGDLVKPDVATMICVCYGLIPAALIFLGAGEHVGRFSGFLLLGMMCAGPMLGLLIGAFLDRAFDSACQRLWGTAVTFTFLGLLACAGIGYLSAIVPTGPPADELARQVRSFILQEWRKHPQLDKASIQKLSLESKGGNDYEGFVEATIAGRPERFALTVQYKNGMIHWKLEPLKQ